MATNWAARTAQTGSALAGMTAALTVDQKVDLMALQWAVRSAVQKVGWRAGP